MAGHGETVTGHQITGHSLLHSTLHLSLVEDWEMILVGLRETFIKRYIVEKTSKAELRPEEQNKKAESCREI